MTLMYVFLFLVGAALAFVVRVWGMALMTAVATVAMVAHAILNGAGFLSILLSAAATIVASNVGYALASVALHYRQRGSAAARTIENASAHTPPR